MSDFESRSRSALADLARAAGEAWDVRASDVISGGVVAGTRRRFAQHLTVGVVLVLAVAGLGIGLDVARGGGPPPRRGQSGGAGLAVTCVPRRANTVPVSRGWIRVWASQDLQVRRGTFVGVEVVEPAAFSSKLGFPWAKPVLSASGVLAPTHLCSPNTPTPPATLAIAVYYFEAVRHGAVTVTVPLKKGWPSHHSGCAGCAPLARLRVGVTVTAAPS